MLSSIVTDPPRFYAACRSLIEAELAAALAGERKAHPAPIQVLEINPNSPQYGQTVWRDQGRYITTTGNSANPIAVAGRVCLANPKNFAESIISGSHRLSTDSEISQELERQQARLVAAQAEDARIKNGKVPFTVTLPGQGAK